jgi:hypothetical protein
MFVQSKRTHTPFQTLSSDISKIKRGTTPVDRKTVANLLLSTERNNKRCQTIYEHVNEQLLIWDQVKEVTLMPAFAVIAYTGADLEIYRKFAGDVEWTTSYLRDKLNYSCMHTLSGNIMYILVVNEPGYLSKIIVEKVSPGLIRYRIGENTQEAERNDFMVKTRPISDLYV